MKKIITILTMVILYSCSVDAQIVEPELRDEVIIENGVFKVWYSEVKEQPVKLVYTSTNRPKNVDRGSMNFYLEDDVVTSNNADYYNNVWDKGHLAPAATYSDSKENLKQTFSFLNCALQDQYLNRGEWRLLEEQERVWDDTEDLTITVTLEWNEGFQILPTNGHVPTHMIKEIYFEGTQSCKRYRFPNQKPTKGWEEYEVPCD